MDFGISSGAFPAVFGLLLIFGALYNQLITRLNRQGYLEGYTWVTVIGGTAVTLLAAIFVIGLESVLILFALFAASGLPMALGDIARHVRARRQAERRS